MIARIAGAAALAAGLALTGAAGAQGFSEGGAAGVAALRGATASPGYNYGASGFRGGRSAGEAADGPTARVPEPAAKPRRMAPTDVDYAPREERSGAFGLPF